MFDVSLEKLYGCICRRLCILNALYEWFKVSTQAKCLEELKISWWSQGAMVDHDACSWFVTQTQNMALLFVGVESSIDRERDRSEEQAVSTRGRVER